MSSLCLAFHSQSYSLVNFNLVNTLVDHLVQPKTLKSIYSKKKILQTQFIHNLTTSVCLSLPPNEKSEAHEKDKWSTIPKWEYLIGRIVTRYLIIYVTHKMMKAKMKVFKCLLISHSSDILKPSAEEWVASNYKRNNIMNWFSLDNTQKSLSKSYVSKKVLNYLYLFHNSA